MFWKKIKRKNNGDEELISQIKSAFNGMHEKVQLEGTDLSKEQRNLLEKNLYLGFLDDLMTKYSSQLTEKKIKDIRKELLILLEECWEKVEPDKTVSLLEPHIDTKHYKD